MKIKIPKMEREELIDELNEIIDRGWVHTGRTRNDGAVGNTLEDLLGIPENNLSVADVENWELKCQRKNSDSLVTLFHLTPYPRKPKSVLKHKILPAYGWKHPKAGLQYPDNEMSFRATLIVNRFTRGLTVVFNNYEQKVEILFDPEKVDETKYREWFETVVSQEGFEKKILCYWKFDTLKKSFDKIKNVAYVVADSRKVVGQEEFKYINIKFLEGGTFESFLKGIADGIIAVDFDIRTGHDHGTKFRINEENLRYLYENISSAV